MLIAHLRTDAVMHARPGSKRRVGVLRARTPHLHTPTAVWVERLSADGRWGRVRSLWRSSGARSGWIQLERARVEHVRTKVVVSLSSRRLEVWRGAELIARMRAGIGSHSSPTPTGKFVVSDRSSPSREQRAAYGSFAFGLSGVQPNPPAGWSGPAQMAIHGTGDPSSIGRAASAGCVRISRAGLALLKPLLAVGTPVIIRR